MDSQSTGRPMELLAPAGNSTALHAAISAGADAAYLGLEAFNARRGADNFTLDSFEQACDYAHIMGAKVYVTLNTIILPQELKAALECARQAYRRGADAFIIQDIGLAKRVGQVLPDARVHLSTQANTLTRYGLEAAANLGARRVTLGREVSLGEIRELVERGRELGLEIETFGHGALCISYSGQCLMSSMIGGRSANRGMCAQACRLPYELHNGSVKNAVKTEGDHLLSPKDLCSVDVLEDLIDAGVASLKIEGRMKSPEYVYEVVSVYRSVIDRIYAQRHDRTTGRGIRATGEEKDRLAQAFSRGFTRAYLDGKRSNDIMSYARPNNRGTSLGRVLSIKEGRALLKVNKPVFKGDVIEFWTKNGHEPYVVNKAEEAGKGQVAIELDKSCSKKVHAQDRVFLLRQADAQFNDDINIPKVPVEATVTCVEGQPLSMTVRIPETKDLPEDASAMEKLIAYRLHNALPEEALTAEIEAAVVEKARTKPITEDDILAHIDRLGGTPFELSGCDINAGEDAGIGFSGLHHLRADALKSLESSITKSFRHERIPKSSPLQLPDRPYAGPAVIVAWATNPVCAKAALKAGASRVYVPALNYEVAEAQIAGQVNSTAQGHGYPQDVVVAMPVASHDSSGKSREAITGFDAWKMAEGKEEVYVESLGDMQHAFDLGLTFEIGPHIPITNEASLNVACEYNAKRIWLSPELTLSQIKELGQKSPISFGITVIGRQELMTTEHCMLMSQGSCNEKCRECPRRRAPYYMKDRKGYLFPVVTDLCGRSHLYNSVMLDIAHVMPDLLSAHVGAFMVDTTFMNREETTEAVLRVKRALKIAQNEGNCVGKAPDTTSGHLFRGVA